MTKVMNSGKRAKDKHLFIFPIQISKNWGQYMGSNLTLLYCKCASFSNKNICAFKVLICNKL